MGIKRENLTDPKIQAMKPEKRLGKGNANPLPLMAGERIEIWDEDVKQMYLRVSHTGLKTFLLLARVKGSAKQVRCTLGQYLSPKAVGALPTVFDPMLPSKFLTLAQAREKARTYLNWMAAGIDPRNAIAAAKQQKDVQTAEAEREAKALAENSFGKVCDRFLAAKKDRLKSGTYQEYIEILASDYIDEWLAMPITSIVRKDIRAMIAAVSEKRSHIVAYKVFAIVRSLFNWAASEDIIEILPMVGMRPPERAKARDRVLSDDELRVVYDCLDATGVFAAPYRLLALTGQRLKEVTELELSEIHGLDGNEPYIELPPDRTKNKMPHVVPLSPMAAAVLREALDKRTKTKCSYVFTTNHVTPISGYSKCKNNLDKAIAKRMAEMKEAAAKAGDAAEGEHLERMFVQPWRIHDLRRTMVTGMNSAGVLPHVVEAVVNHISGAAKAGVAGVYNRAQYLPERRQALNMWADHIASLTNPPSKGADVAHLRTGKTYKKMKK